MDDRKILDRLAIFGFEEIDIHLALGWLSALYISSCKSVANDVHVPGDLPILVNLE